MQILELAESARQHIEELVPGGMDERIGLAWCATEQEFYSRLGSRRGHLLAVAVPTIRRVYLNGEKLRQLDRREFRRALVHEFMHIYLGRRIPDGLPLWLNEGLAMHAAGDWDFADGTALAAASLFGTLFTPRELSRRFPADAAGQARAYRQSYSMTAYLIHLRYPSEGLRGLLADLVNDSNLRSLFLDPDWQEEFDRQWRDRWIRPTRVILVVTSSAAVWILVAALLITAYARKRRQTKRHEARWALEEEFTCRTDEFDD